MIYTLNIENAKEESGKILLDRLIYLASSITKISEGALQLKLLGVSNRRGRKKISYDDALEIKLIGIKNKSTALLLECDSFKNTLHDYQTDLFDSDFFNHTPISIMIDCYSVILDENIHDSDIFLDRALIKSLKELSHAFKSPTEILTISNGDMKNYLSLTKDKVESIELKEQEIPKDQKLIVTGILEELKYSKHRVKIQIEEGLLNAYISEKIEPEYIAKYWGKEITLAGIMHYGINFTKNFEITRIFEDTNKGENVFFKEIPRQTILTEIKPQNPLVKWKGKWPGEESFEELVDSL